MNAVLVFSLLLFMFSLAFLAVRWRRTGERKTFWCPHCGGHYWSSGQPFAVGRCVGCGFTWKRVDDARYFESDR